MTSRILVVDDDPLLAMDAAATLADAGYAIVGPSHSVSEADALIRQSPPDAALLDLNLGQETSLPLVHQLRALGIPILLLSGYDGRSLPEDVRDTPRLTKPFLEDVLVREIAALLPPSDEDRT